MNFSKVIVCKLLLCTLFVLRVFCDEVEIADENALAIEVLDENSTTVEKIEKPQKLNEVKSFIFENDFIAGTDEHYTNGLYYTWLNDENIYLPSFLDINSPKKSKSFTLSHMMFTPTDLSSQEAVNTDVPYAGYLGLNYSVFQYSSNYFHELGYNIGYTGKYTYAKEVQTAIHKITGNTVPNGWDNQLKSHLIAGVTYQYGAKTDKWDLEYFELDALSHMKFTLGELYSGARVGWIVRIGNKLRDSFQTTGDFLGGLESGLLNYKTKKGFYWVLSYGGFANSINHFYIMDASDQYEIDTINYVSGDFFAYSVGYNSLDVTFHMKTNYVNSFHKGSLGARYGGVIITWEF